MKDQSFYNTINLEAKDLSLAQVNALTQEQRILRWFMRQGRTASFGPSAVLIRVFHNGTPLTSVRRAMTSLTKRGDLIKCAAMIMGTYGKPEHLWTVSAKWTPAQPKQGELL